MKFDLLYITFFLQPITCWYWTPMLEANVDELMLLYRCSSERNDFISYTSFFPANKGSSLINRKQAAQQATTKAKAKTWSWRAGGATWKINPDEHAISGTALRYQGSSRWRWVAVSSLASRPTLTCPRASAILRVELWPRQRSVKPITTVGVTSRMPQMWGNLGHHTTLTGNALQSRIFQVVKNIIRGEGYG